MIKCCAVCSVNSYHPQAVDLASEASKPASQSWASARIGPDGGWGKFHHFGIFLVGFVKFIVWICIASIGMYRYCIGWIHKYTSDWNMMEKQNGFVWILSLSYLLISTTWMMVQPVAASGSMVLGKHHLWFKTPLVIANPTLNTLQQIAISKTIKLRCYEHIWGYTPFSDKYVSLCSD